MGFATTHGPWLNRAERLVSSYRKASFKDIPDDNFYPFGIEGDRPEKPDNPEEVAAQYYASVTQIDEMLGRVLDELDALGQSQDTLLVYTSDHGLNLGHHQVWGKGNGTRPLNMLEESIRVPLILNHPADLPEGNVQNEFVNHTDLFMTLLDFAGASLEEGGYPGQSYRPLLTDVKGDWRDVHIGEYGPVRMIRTQTHKLVLREPLGCNLLFDLEKDPRETHNLFDQAENQSLIEALSKRIMAFFGHYEDPRYSGQNSVLPKHNDAEAWDNFSAKGG